MREVRVASLPPEYKLYRTLIEVIDPAAKRVLARRTFDGYIFGALSENRVAAYVETEAGVPVVTIYRVTLNPER